MFWKELLPSTAQERRVAAPTAPRMEQSKGIQESLKRKLGAT